MLILNALPWIKRDKKKIEAVVLREHDDGRTVLGTVEAKLGTHCGPFAGKVEKARSGLPSSK